MLSSLAVLVGSLLLLTFGAEVLVRGASAVARRLGVSSFFIGLTIVGFGTSTPELATGITAALNGLADVNVGNVVGSNIFNIALILGLTAVICPIPIRARVVRGEVLVVIGAAFVPYAALLTGSVLTRWQGAAMVALLLAYLWRGYRIGRREGDAERELERELEREVGAGGGPAAGGAGAGERRTSAWVNVALIATGLVILVVGSRLLVDSSVQIARTLGVSELVIALTIVAAGTSAPELFTSMVAAVRGQSDISVGNILGSNIFNVLGILGISCLVSPQRLSPQVVWLDAPVMIAASIACLPIMLSQHRVSRAEGVVFLTGYLAYLIVLFTLAPGWFAGGA